MNSILCIDDNGKAELYDDDYNITIFCKDEQEQQRAMKRLETANRMRWHDAKTDPPEDSRDVIVYRDGIGSVMGFFDHEIHKRWLDANTCAFLDDVTHWMEKPEDPKKKRKREILNEMHFSKTESVSILRRTTATRHGAFAH